MNLDYLDFEQPIAELQQKIEELRHVATGSEVNLSEEIGRLESKSRSLTEDIFGKLTSWQVAQVARHPRRPYTLDYIEAIFTDFTELHGDRAFRDDPAIVGGLARLDGRAVMVIGQQKGRDTKDKLHRNFGMPKPEGYRKALRLMKLAERFRVPIITFIDTPGAYPGIGAEERNQSEAIGVADHLAMLQYSIYSVISPEGCASILYRSAEKAAEAADAMGVTSSRIYELGLIDEIIPEPLGGAHRDPAAMAETLTNTLLQALDELQPLAGPGDDHRAHNKPMLASLAAHPKSGDIRRLASAPRPGDNYDFQRGGLRRRVNGS